MNPQNRINQTVSLEDVWSLLQEMNRRLKALETAALPPEMAPPLSETYLSVIAFMEMLSKPGPCGSADSPTPVEGPLPKKKQVASTGSDTGCVLKPLAHRKSPQRFRQGLFLVNPACKVRRGRGGLASVYYRNEYLYGRKRDAQNVVYNAYWVKSYRSFGR
jgi:hypothetical protein